MVEVVSLGSITIPSGVLTDETICHFKLSCTGGSLSNVPITICLSDGANIGASNSGGIILYYHGVNVPNGTNTASIAVKYGNIKKWRTKSGHWQLYRSSQEAFQLMSQGFFQSEGTIPTYTYE